MAKIINGVDVEAFMRLEGRILEPVPEAERQDYQFWRAIHLGAIALNHLKGNRVLNNAWLAPWTHYRTAYQEALGVARGMPGRISQFGPEHNAEMQAIAGAPNTFAYPTMVSALDKSFNGSRRVEHLPSLYDYLDGPELFPRLPYDAPHSPSGGYFLRGRLTADMLDPHSRRVIEEIFGRTEN